VRFAVRTSATRPEDLRSFTGKAGELRFDAAASTDDELVFVRGPAPRGKAGAGAGTGAGAGRDAGAGAAPVPAPRGRKRTRE
jgi:hypothetical protein